MNKYLTGNKILPTAQYASIKYDRGTKHIYPHFVWDSKLDPKKDIRGVRANNPLYSEPGEIMREILYSPSTNLPVDTTYREYPTALLPVKIQTRVASSNDLDRKEYETLKRRFNTAWNVSRPHIRYGMFKNGGLIPKYLYGGPLNRYFRAGNDGYYYGIKSGKRYTALDAARWLRENHIGNYNAQLFVREFDRQNPQQLLSSNNFFSTIGRGLSGYVKDFFTYQGNGNALMKLNTPGQLYMLGKNMYEASQQEELPLTTLILEQQYINNKFQWNNKYLAKIGNKYKGLGYNEYMQEFNKWFDQQNFNPLEKANRNYIAKQNWDKYVQLGYNKPINVINDVIVTQNKDSEDDYLNNNIQTDTTSGLVLPTSAATQVETPEYQNGMRYVYNNGKFELIPTETETSIKPEVPTYESLVKVNTASMNSNINSGNFRRLYRKAFNEALLNGTIYGKNNPNGTLVFDSNAVMGYDENGNPIYATANNIMQKYGLDGKISRRDMRMLRKDIIKNQNLVRMNNVSNFLGITSPAVASPATEEVVSTLSGVYLGATPEETANLKLNYDWSKTI